jgi:beta-lactamase regulating signal transducer with metallopeptidase domain
VIALAIEALAASAVLMLAVLVMRGPVRRAFGPELAYALWAIPALRLILPPLPAAWREQVATPIVDMGHQATAFIAPYVDAAPVVVPEAAPVDLVGPAALLLWATGAGAFLLWQLARYRRFRVDLMRAAVPLDRSGAVEIVESDAATSPLAFGIVHRVVAFPRDFAERYDEGERALALAHELGHHRRGDLYANWVALAVLALHWFNPIAWYAYRAFRADQEMANDAGVIARLGVGARHAYGCAIVKAAHGRALSPACHLHTIKDLKGRLRMLGQKRASRTRRVMGGAIGAGLSLGALAVTASGTQAAERVRSKVETVTGVELAALDPVAALTPIVAAAPAAAPAPAAGRERREPRVTVVRGRRTITYTGDEAAAYIAAHPVAIPPIPPVPPMPPIPELPKMTRVPAIPSVPPVPPIPATPAVPVLAQQHCGGTGDARGEVVIRERRGDREVTVICTDRIAARAAATAQMRAKMAERQAAWAEKAAEAAGRRAEAEGRRAEAEGARAERFAQATQRRALTSALAGLERTRAGMARNGSLYGEHREEALRGIDEAIADMRDEIRDIGRD